MADQQHCPDSSRLQALLDGTASDTEQTELARHLETCASCRDAFEAMVGGADLVPEKAAESTPRGSKRSPILQEAVERLKSEGPGTIDDTINESSGNGLSLGFLSPSSNPRHLGRLAEYEIVEMIGRGGMGIVLKAHDPRLDRYVAVKVLSPELASDGTARRRFLREAQAAAAVSHDHVVTIHAVEETEGLPFLVMEYIVGVSLSDRIQRSGHLRTEEILRIGMQAAAGLAAAHAQGLVHRDIKPGNILLENGVERVKITDFGLARAVHEAQITQRNAVAGTPQYMSPEQARGERIDHRSDLFSLGCVLYAMCTGRSPFRAETVVDSIRRVCDDTPRPIQEVNPDIPDWLIEIVDRLLEKEPDLRFQSATKVADLLGEHLAHLQQPSVAPKPARLSRVAGASRETPRHQTWPLWGAALATVLLVAGLGAYLGGWFRPSPPPDRIVGPEPDPTVDPIVTGPHALQFDGDDFVAIPSLYYDGRYPITFEAVIKPKLSYPAQVPDVAKGSHPGRTIMGDAAPSGGISFAVRPYGLAMVVRGAERHRETAALEVPFPSDPVHVAAVFDPQMQIVRLFVDGQMKGEGPFVWSYEPSSTAFVIGACAWNSESKGKRYPDEPSDVIKGFRGTIDAVRISNIARYTENFIPEPRFEPDATTIALYHFDEGTGTVARDSSENDNDGTITGAEWVAAERYTPPPPIASPKRRSGTGKPEGGIDLLALVDLPRDRGRDGYLDSDGESVVLHGADSDIAALRVPYSLPDEYELVLDATCFSRGTLDIRTPIENGFWFFVFHHSMGSGLVYCDRADRWEPLHDARRDPILPIGRRFRLRCIVEREGTVFTVRAFADGRAVFSWRGDPETIFSPSSVVLPPKRTHGLYVTVHGRGGYRIHGLRIRPLNGGGHPILDGEAPTDDCAAARHIVWRGNPVWISEGGAEPARLEMPEDLPRGDFHLVGAEFRRRPTTAFSDLLILSGLPHLRKIDLCGQQWLCGADVRKWLDLPALEEFHLANTWISDEDIEKLPRLPQLETLDLSFTNVTDEGLATLLQCTDLERLILRGTQITDRGMRHVAELRSLKELDLSGTSITDKGLRSFSRIGSIERLVLDHTAVSDVGLTHLSQAKSLKRVSLMHTQITAGGLRKLAELPALEKLCLIGTDISAENLASLRQTMASCDIQHHLGGEVDLLNAIRVERDTVQGTWRIEEGQLMSPAKTRHARLQVPYMPPDEYILKATIRRTSAMNTIRFGLPSTDRQFCVAIDGWVRSNGRSGLELVDGESHGDNATTFMGPVVEGGEPTEVVITVRRSHITATVDGRLVVDWEGDFDRLSLEPQLQVPRTKAIFLDTWLCCYVVSKLSLTPISGTGRFLDGSSVAAPQKGNQQGGVKGES